MRQTGQRFQAPAFGAALIAAFAAVTACERAADIDPSPVTVGISGDSLVQMRPAPGDDGAGDIECTVSFRATVEGPEGAHALLRSGRVQYWWWQTGGEAGSYTWTQPALAQLWGDTIFAVGHDRLSHGHSYGQQQPARPLRGEVSFEYGATNNDEVRQTEPYRFYCY